MFLYNVHISKSEVFKGRSRTSVTSKTKIFVKELNGGKSLIIKHKSYGFRWDRGLVANLLIFSLSTNSWYLMIMTASHRAYQLPNSKCTKIFFSVIFPKSYVPKWGERHLGTMLEYRSLRGKMGERRKWLQTMSFKNVFFQWKWYWKTTFWCLFC